MANPYLDKYLNKVNEAGAFAKNAQTGIDQGVNEVKGKFNYDAKVKELEDANSQVLDTRKALKGLNKNVQDRTAGRLVTNAQLQRIQAAERDPLSRQLGDQSESANLASGNFSNVSKLIDNYISGKRTANSDYLQGLNTEAQGLWKGYEASESDEAKAYKMAQDAENKAYRASRDSIGDSYNSSLLNLQRLGLAGGASGAGGMGGEDGMQSDIDKDLIVETNPGGDNINTMPETSKTPGFFGDLYRTGQGLGTIANNLNGVNASAQKIPYNIGTRGNDATIKSGNTEYRTGTLSTGTRYVEKLSGVDALGRPKWVNVGSKTPEGAKILAEFSKKQPASAGGAGSRVTDLLNMAKKGIKK